jgi:hypothetical protein
LLPFSPEPSVFPSVVKKPKNEKWRALVNAVMNLWVPQNVGKLSSGYIIGGLLSSFQFHRVNYVDFRKLG